MLSAVWWLHIAGKLVFLEILHKCIFAIRLDNLHESGGINNWGSTCPLSEATFPTGG